MSVVERIADTGLMFHLRRSTETRIIERIAQAGGPAVQRILSLKDGTKVRTIGRFAHDKSSSHLGVGERTFVLAKRAFADWTMFDLGWVRVANASAPIVDGQIVAVEVRALGLWSVNLSRVVETVDSEFCFGFIYATTEQHVEQGEESFLLRFDPATGEVRYILEAVSRPRHWVAGLAIPRRGIISTDLRGTLIGACGKLLL